MTSSSAARRTTSRVVAGRPVDRSAVRAAPRGSGARARQNAQNRPVVGWPHRSHDESSAASAAREQRPAPVEVPEEELRLRPRRAWTRCVHRVLVPELGVAGDQRALLHHVVDARGGTRTPRSPAPRAGTSGLTFFTMPSRPGRAGDLAGDVLGVPTERVAQQRRGLVVEVVAGGDHVEAALEGRPVEHVALRQPADRAGRPRPLPAGRSGCRSRSRRARSTSIELARRARPRTPRSRRAERSRVVADAESQVQARRRRSRGRAARPTAPASPCRRRSRRGSDLPPRTCRAAGSLASPVHGTHG